MRAATRATYGSPDVVELRDIDKPAVEEGRLLVRVQAASVNPVDLHMLTGTPYLVRLQDGIRKPNEERLGVDFAGTVEAVGPDVERFRPGDEVFGARDGAFAEYVSVREAGAVVTKPPGLSFEQAASVPVAASTALQGLRDKGGLRSGQRVLINGASGGVGTFAVQIAKAFDAEVTGVCRTRNVELVESLGADTVVDYTKEDFTRLGRRYDLLLDIAGNRSWREYTRVLNDDATLVVVGGPKTNRWIGPLGHLVGMRLASIGGGRSVVPFLAKTNAEDLVELMGLLEAEKVTPVIDRRYELAEIAEALRYVGEGHARAKVVVAV
jgi:NADPH:quinone reductase-like Zn-dependent oxidoreductase